MRKRNRFLGKRWPSQGQAKYRPDFARYEAEKQNWLAHHPGCTADEYTAAVRQIAWRCGI